MLGNYFRIAWRNLNGNKVSSAIDRSGSAIGLAFVSLIGRYVKANDIKHFFRGFDSFGLAPFTAVKRTKEIGARQVLGSSVQNILLRLKKSASTGDHSHAHRRTRRILRYAAVAPGFCLSRTTYPGGYLSWQQE